MDVTMQLSGDLGAQLASFVDEVLEVGLRPAARAGALVLYNEARTLVPVYKGEVYTRSNGRKTTPGQLLDSIYHVHSDSQSSHYHQVYEVSWNSRKAPHGWLVEFGHWRVNEIVRGEDGKWRATKNRLDVPVWVPAHSFIRRAYAARADAAIAASQERLTEKITEIQRRP